MATLWFKQMYVPAILSGEKADTLRPGDVRHKFRVGDVLTASVGPRPPFAELLVEAVELVAFAALPAERQAGLRRIYGERAAEQAFTRVAFYAAPVPTRSAA